ncbi:GNAT family N-acetyltransferase [Algoriphagus limi]|uniref:GNAT family N-acetyltransferase n=1 Tax=Algoriphagus limi TaxID=2975273 RepID=A0ABT2G5B4_9BACT|nr:GNAT family N-acetyltransferase [Algoriphagus limi]MCS5490449.1 GNAT family N-acetyltransferase [Algoriphagus limi]
MIEIVPAQKKDLKTIQEIAYQTWPSTFGEILTTGQISYMLGWMYSLDTLEKQLEEEQYFFLAKEDGKALGFTAFELNYEPQKTKIHKIYILPSAQGKGIGKKLFSKIEEIATGKNQSALLLNVNKGNKQAIDFYKRYGFEELRREVIDIGEGFVMDDIVFEFKL